MIVPRNPDVARAAAGGQDTIGLRCPDHPVALALLRAAARHGVLGVAAPSANRFGRISPTRAEHVMGEFADDDLWVLDGGACEVGIESAIVDCSRAHPVLLRPGRLTRDDLEAAAGEPIRWSRPEAPDPSAPRASGTLLAHYAPRAKVRLMSAQDIAHKLQALGPHANNLGLWSAVRPDDGAGLGAGVLWRAQPQMAEQAAHALFSVLRDLDARGVQQIWVQLPPDTPEWEGVRDRLQRAAA